MISASAMLSPPVGWNDPDFQTKVSVVEPDPTPFEEGIDQQLLDIVFGVTTAGPWDQLTFYGTPKFAAGTAS